MVQRLAISNIDANRNTFKGRICSTSYTQFKSSDMQMDHQTYFEVYAQIK